LARRQRAATVEDLMTEPLRVLAVEDAEDDALLLGRALAKGGYAPVTLLRVETGAELAAALEREAWDLVVTDYSLPLFSGPEAIEVVKSSGRDVPVIVVSGTVSEEVAVACMRSGANDFIAKGNLTRLAPAIARELREAALRRERVAALQESQDRYRFLFETSPLATLAFDMESRVILEANEAATTLYGYSHAELLGMRLDDFWPPDETAKHLEYITGLGVGPARMTKLRHLKRDKSTCDVELFTHVLPTKNGRVVRFVIVNDVTERQVLEAQLRQAQKMDAVGQLAGGVAHDFNNILAAILSYTELIAGDLGAEHPSRPDLDEIRVGAFRAAELTRQLLAFSRQQVLQPAIVDLNSVVVGLEKMLRRTISEDVALLIDLAPHLGRVRVDRGQMEQVVLNLAVNARDAMPNGGTLTIRTFEVPADSDGVRRIALSVTDTGTGIDAQTQAHIFEPFFTTKPVGKGTGLGLATVYGIARQSQGYVEVTSSVGHGAVFTLFLPRVEDSLSASPKPVLRARTVCTETVLLVEDEHALRRVAARILRKEGYQVLEAANAAEARELSDQHTGMIDLLLTDVVMPMTSGPALAAELTRARVAMRVLFVSGYADDRSASRIPADAAFLEKPFTPDGLIRKLRETLDAASPARA
jgi:PAS domain S-box-containing protein